MAEAFPVEVIEVDSEAEEETGAAEEVGTEAAVEGSQEEDSPRGLEVAFPADAVSSLCALWYICRRFWVRVYGISVVQDFILG